MKTFTDDFRTVWFYRPIGVKVFFGKDGTVEAIRFQAAEKGAKLAPPAGTDPQESPPAAAGVPAAGP
jgi:hypothetical protein